MSTSEFVSPSKANQSKDFLYRCLSPEVTYPYPLYKDPAMEKLRLAHMKQNTVGTVIIHGVRIVSLIMDAKERLCLAQISNTLLKDYSYNEIHNRRVALGITCVQCTPVQLEILRRAGAMPISSRRCGMITRREAERLCKSFLGDNSPPRLPDNFAFEILHDCAWGCRGQFVPGRYNSSRAKCIKCSYCAIFFSPNKVKSTCDDLRDPSKFDFSLCFTLTVCLRRGSMSNLMRQILTLGGVISDCWEILLTRLSTPGRMSRPCSTVAPGREWSQEAQDWTGLAHP